MQDMLAGNVHSSERDEMEQGENEGNAEEDVHTDAQGDQIMEGEPRAVVPSTRATR